ncbi:hypothetical protein [Psychrobacter okhotskensis]|uniref:hypothetical protein n=1 Tax=Psychrobacter okhotskensis TaxID=212403 RepID=UPI003D0042C3
MMILLLPGADGTGVLFKPFIEVLQAAINTEHFSKASKPISSVIINLNHDEMGNPLAQKLSEQATRIENEYEGQSVVVIAESYSGLLAYELLSRQQLDITHVVFVASFLKAPSKFVSIVAKLNPVWLKGAIRTTPSVIWGRVLFGRWQTPQLRALFRQALAQTPNDLLQQRLAIIASAQIPNKTIDVPCLYLQARQDSLVSANNIEIFRQVFSNFASITVDGTHFLLQTNPEAVWEALRESILTTIIHN